MLSSRENIGEKEKGCPSLGEAPEENTAESPAQFLWREAPERDQGLGRLFKRQLVKGDHLGVKEKGTGDASPNSLERAPRGVRPGPSGPLQLGL